MFGFGIVEFGLTFSAWRRLVLEKAKQQGDEAGPFFSFTYSAVDVLVFNGILHLDRRGFGSILHLNWFVLGRFCTWTGWGWIWEIFFKRNIGLGSIL